MSFEIAVKVEDLSKCYAIYNQPRDRLKQFILPRLQNTLGLQTQDYFQGFWALQNISFEVKKGETVGIIGRNGSGKSTLLQIICGTLSANSGVVTSNGRIAALLELGTGFNPEFTGRENIYMNGAVLGLTKKQIDARFNSITEFADIGDFINQPVKTYSSGMYVRLAFAVVAHVDADILIIDEALAVGDAIFTQKCMRFLRAFKGKGTLIFVSHDMSSVLNLCERAIWLDQGRIKGIGESKIIGEAYLQYTLQQVYGQQAILENTDLAAQSEGNSSESELEINNEVPAMDYGARMTTVNNVNGAKGWKTGAGVVLSVQLEKVPSQDNEIFVGGEKVRMVITAKAQEDMEHPILGFLVRDRLGQDLFGENTLPFTDINPRPVAAGTTFSAEFIFRLPMLPNGQYVVMASLADGDLYNHIQHHWLHDAMIINVSSSQVRWGLVGVQFEKVELRSCP